MGLDGKSQTSVLWNKQLSRSRPWHLDNSSIRTVIRTTGDSENSSSQAAHYDTWYRQTTLSHT